MAEETVNSQTVDKTATPASVEPEIESLLPNIPDLADLFAGTPTTQETGKAPEQPKDGATKKEPVTPETADKEQHLEDLIPAGLKPEEDKPPEEPKKEEIPPPDKFQQRIDELTAKRKSAEEKATALETELFELKAKAQAPPPLAPTPSNPLSDVMTEADLQKRIAYINEVKAWCIQNPDGGPVSDGNGGTKHVDGAAVKDIWVTAEKTLYEGVPQRKEFLANKKLFDTEAQKQYPALFKQGTEPNTVYHQWLTAFPECQRYPDIALIIGDALVGQKIRLDRAKARPNGLPPAHQAPLATPAPAASPRVPQTRALSGDALSAAFQLNPDAALTAFVDNLIDRAEAQRSR